MYFKRTVEMARNRPPSFYEQGDLGQDKIEIKEYESGEFQLWRSGYCSAYPIGPITPDLGEVRRLFVANLADMTSRYGGGVWVYDAIDIETYHKALWAQ